jgi:hypothetical protein
MKIVRAKGPSPLVRIATLHLWTELPTLTSTV